MKNIKKILAVILPIILLVNTSSLSMAKESDEYYKLRSTSFTEEEINDLIKYDMETSEYIANSIRNNPIKYVLEPGPGGGEGVFIGVNEPYTKYTASQGDTEIEKSLLTDAYAKAEIISNSNYVAAASYGLTVGQAIAWTGFRFKVQGDYYGVTSSTARFQVTYDADHFLIGQAACLANKLSVFDVTDDKWILKTTMDLNVSRKNESKSVHFKDKHYTSDRVTLKEGHEYVVVFETKATAGVSSRVDEAELLHYSKWSQIYINW